MTQGCPRAAADPAPPPQTAPAAAPAADAAADAARAEADARSVHVSGVDYAATPADVQAHFQGCGTVNRVTILADRTGNPKGFGCVERGGGAPRAWRRGRRRPPFFFPSPPSLSYVEFLEPDAVANALLLDGSELKGRALRVAPKRTNVPGLKAARGRGRGRGGGGRGPPRGRGRGRGARGGGRFYSPY